MKTFAFIVVIFLLFITSGCVDTARIPKWSVYEMTLVSEKEYANPYLDADAKAIFLSPTGDSVRVHAFWDGGDTFRIRFTPGVEGEWRYYVQNDRHDEGLMRRGKLVVTEPEGDSYGFVRRDPDYPYHFMYDDGRRYYMTGTTYYNILLNALAGSKWKKAIDSARVFGINKFRTTIIPVKNSVTPYPQVWPFHASGDSLDYTRLNLVLWKKMDSVIRYANSRGMIVDLMPFGVSEKCYAPDSSMDKRYLRYILARYAAWPNIIWCLVNEWNYREARLGKDKPYWNMMGEIVRHEDPFLARGDYLRPLSIHQQTRIDFQFFNSDWPVHAIIQLGVRNGQGTVADEWDIPAGVQPGFKEGDAWGNAGIIYNLGHNMPVVNDEFGYIGEPRDRAASDSPDRDKWPRFTRERHRNVLWGIAVAGGYGSTGDKNSYSDGRPYFSGNWHSDPKEYRDIKNMHTFFTGNGIEYWKMSADNELVIEGNRVYALAEPGLQYIFYAAEGGTFTATIGEGNYRVQLFDPRTGELLKYGSCKGGLNTLTLPDDRDWVIWLDHVKR